MKVFKKFHKSVNYFEFSDPFRYHSDFSNSYYSEFCIALVIMSSVCPDSFSFTFDVMAPKQTTPIPTVSYFDYVHIVLFIHCFVSISVLDTLVHRDATLLSCLASPSGKTYTVSRLITRSVRFNDPFNQRGLITVVWFRLAPLVSGDSRWFRPVPGS